MNRFARFSAALIVSVAAASPVLAAPETYTIDSTHTFPSFSYSHFGMSTQVSKFDKTSGPSPWTRRPRPARSTSPST